MGNARRTARKKLKAVVRALYGADDGEEQVDGAFIVQEARKWGASEAEIAELAKKAGKHAPRRRRIVEIEPENLAGFRLFCRMRTQWLTQAMPTPRGSLLLRTGLDYTAIESVARAIGVILDEDVFDALQVAEGEALKIYAERNDELLEAMRRSS